MTQEMKEGRRGACLQAALGQSPSEWLDLGSRQLWWGVGEFRERDAKGILCMYVYMYGVIPSLPARAKAHSVYMREGKVRSTKAGPVLFQAREGGGNTLRRGRQTADLELNLPR